MAWWTSQREDHTSDWLRTVSISGLGQTTNSCSRAFAGDIYGDHVLSCAGIIGIKLHHNVVHDNPVDICYRYEISAGKEVDIGLDGGRDKPLRPVDMLLYSWDEGLDVCVDLTGSSPLTQTGIVDFVAGWIVIDVAQRKRGKYMAKCAAIGYGFLPFSFSSLEESEADAVTLLKRIRKFSMAQDIEAYRLINNLCMVWVGRNKIHANVARFQREPLHKQSNKVNNKGTNNVNHWEKGMTNSYAHVVKGNQVQNVGKVKEFASITNLNVVLGKEGYANIKLKYMGGFWVMIVFQDDETKKRFQFNLAVGSWFSQIIQAHNDFVKTKGLYGWRLRAFHVSGGLEIHLAVSQLDGVPGWVPDFEEDGKEGYDVNDGSHEDDMYGGVLENLKDVECESDREEVSKTNFEEATLHKDSLNSRKSILKAELADLDGVIDKEEGSNVDGHRRREVVRLIQEVEKVDAMEVAQKAKIKWSIEVDENSKYFHGVLNKNRGRVTILGVLVDGLWMESPHLVKHEFFEHFKNRFEKHNKSRILLERNFVKRISLEQNDDLEREVSNEEIKKAVWDCGDNANMVKDFRPISLIGSLYKVIAKVLAHRLVTVLDDIVDEIHSAFVTNRQILDGPFILNEIGHWCKNKKKQSMVFKVDFKKAYNSVRWDFIDDILRRCGFGEKWCKWIQSCLYSSRGSVLVNESPTKEFQFHKGLKQGDPLSLFLFILVMESLHVSFQRVVDAGLRISMNKSYLMGIFMVSNKVKHAAAKIVPMKVLQNMESICSLFNGADVNSKKPSWVRWKSVLAAKDVGGLGVSSLFALNWALMFKWVWRFFSQKNSLWFRVVKALHAWCGNIAFKNLVPRWYALESMKNIEVASKLSHEGMEFSFRCNPRGGVEQA
nr:RNA-directed DNA polymerase, eukaryota [Tanacetum cinerariifolium]